MPEIRAEIVARHVSRIGENLSHRCRDRRWRVRIVGTEDECEIIAGRLVAVDVAIHDGGEGSTVAADVADAESKAPGRGHRPGNDELVLEVGVGRTPRS